MVYSTARGKMARPQPVSQRRWWHSLWVWLTVALAIVVLALWARSAAAQTERGSEIAARALVLQPDDDMHPQDSTTKRLGT